MLKFYCKHSQTTSDIDDNFLRHNNKWTKSLSLWYDDAWDMFLYRQLNISDYVLLLLVSWLFFIWKCWFCYFSTDRFVILCMCGFFLSLLLLLFQIHSLKIISFNASARPMCMWMSVFFPSLLHNFIHWFHNRHCEFIDDLEFNVTTKTMVTVAIFFFQIGYHHRLSENLFEKSQHFVSYKCIEKLTKKSFGHTLCPDSYNKLHAIKKRIMR